MGKVGEHQQQRDHPAEGQQQGGGGPGVAGEEELAVPDQIACQQDQHQQVRWPVLHREHSEFLLNFNPMITVSSELCLCMKVSRLLHL